MFSNTNINYTAKFSDKKDGKQNSLADLLDMESVSSADDNKNEGSTVSLPLSWDDVFSQKDPDEDVICESSDIIEGGVSGALAKCLANRGKVDISYIASLAGCTAEEVLSELKGSVYQNPAKWNGDPLKGWETSAEYLSGNLKRKLDVAVKANREHPGVFKDNVRVLKKMLGSIMTDSGEIYVTLGSPWVPADVIDDFIDHILGEPMWYFSRRSWKQDEAYQTKHNEMTGEWEIPVRNRYNHSVAVTHTYGTEKLEALQILERTLNMRNIRVTREVPSAVNASGVKRELDEKATVEALEKQKLMIEEFHKWIWNDEKRRARLEKIYEDNYCCFRRRSYDGSFLTFTGMSEDVQLYKYQKDAAARMIFSPNTLLAHDVGAGKTYSMIAAGQEMLRMGLSKKNMFVVPNNILGQWERIFHEMYPDAKLLMVGPKEFKPTKRNEVTSEIRDGKYDAVIIAYSCFEQIPLSRDYYIDKIRSERKEVQAQLIGSKGADSKLRARDKKLAKELDKIYSSKKSNDEFAYFDELGITRLFVDEAHNFKNVPVETRISHVNGISRTGSRKCKEMMDKVHMVQKNNNGGGVVLATGTPITNSITDIFIMQKYLQSGELEMLDIGSFDSWVGMFAEKQTEFEVDVDTNNYRLASRFSRFHNLPELTSLISGIADFHRLENADDLPGFDGYTDAEIKRTKEFTSYLDDISVRADKVRAGKVSRKKDNMLKITTDGRKAALDLRLVDEKVKFNVESKVVACADNVAGIFFGTENDKSAQLVFCDTSTPKTGFNMYDELKKRLMMKGVPEDQIAYIHDATSEKKRNKMLNDVSNGDIRILIGSTFKLGLGVNVQERLIALHHLDVPWRPADMTQREGRILRQGNMNPKVMIFRYITKGSFDAYSWQLLETKQKFIAELLAGSLDQRSGSDIDDTALSYAEVKALAVRNPLVKEKFELTNEMNRLRTLQSKLVSGRLKMQEELEKIPAEKKDWQRRIDACREDKEFVKMWNKENPTAQTNAEKKEEAERRREIRGFIDETVKGNVLSPDERVLMQYRGFDIVLPRGMSAEEPFVWLRRKGSYVVKLSDTAVGNLVRIDNTIEGLGDLLDKYKDALNICRNREKDIKEELGKKDDYLDQISVCREKIEEIDEVLEVKKDA